MKVFDENEPDEWNPANHQHPMNTNPFNRPDEHRSDSIHGEPKLPPPPLLSDEVPVSPWWAVAILAGIVAFILSVMAGCAGTRAGDVVAEYRDTHEARVAFELRGGMAWIGFGIVKVGKAAEIEVIEGEKPYSAKSGL